MVGTSNKRLQIPRFIFEFDTHSESELRINTENYSTPVRKFENNEMKLIILGHPILGDRVDREGVWKSISISGILPHFLRSINGEFLLILVDVRTKSIKVISDRFTSIPLYYAARKNRFVASVYYYHLWQSLKARPEFKLNEPAFFEFLWLQRLLGNKTYDSTSCFLPPATCATYNGEEVSLDNYWTPSFEKTPNSLHKCAIDLAERLQCSLRRKSYGVERLGLFLSGGLDSRIVLASMQSRPICFTAAISQNNEFEVAREVTESQGLQHIYLPIASDPYSGRLADLVQLTGGMFAFDHALFAGYQTEVSSHADLIFHGHGIDYMFQGMYVPSEPVTLAGRKMMFHRPKILPEDLVSEYLNSIPYRLKGIDLLRFIKSSQRSNLYDSLRNSVKELIDTGAAFCETPYDKWEFMLMHGLARHYSRPNLDSMAMAVEQRTATFDNDVFDLYLTLPPEFRLDGHIARLVLMEANSNLARIRVGNTNMRPDRSLRTRELHKLWDSMLVRTRLRRRTRYHAPAEERTWPDRGRLFATQSGMRRVALDLCQSEALDSLNFLDMDLLSKEIPEWLDDPNKENGAFLCFLVTVDQFLKQ